VEAGLGSLEFWIGIAHWLTGIGTIVLAIAIIMTFRHLATTTKMSKIETKFRLRPWIGPSSSLKKINASIDGNIQFSLTIKNFGYLPASYVKVKSKIDDKQLTRESLNQSLDEFNLGPLLPQMEKTYWLFVDPSMWEKISNNHESIYAAIYFQYESISGLNGYGMISEFKINHTIVNKDMWLVSSEKS